MYRFVFVVKSTHFITPISYISNKLYPLNSLYKNKMYQRDKTSYNQPTNLPTNLPSLNSYIWIISYIGDVWLLPQNVSEKLHNMILTYVIFSKFTIQIFRIHRNNISENLILFLITYAVFMYIFMNSQYLSGIPSLHNWFQKRFRKIWNVIYRTKVILFKI